MIVMNNLPDILRFLRSTEAANKFTELYGKREGVLLYQMERYCRIAKRFFEEFGTVEGVRFFSAPGRTEIGGNHTDHQAGRVLAAGVNLDTVAIAAPTDNGVITVYSEGYDGALVVAGQGGERKGNLHGAYPRRGGALYPAGPQGGRL